VSTASGPELSDSVLSSSTTTMNIQVDSIRKFRHAAVLCYTFEVSKLTIVPAI